MKLKLLLIPLAVLALSGCALMQGSSAGDDALKATDMLLSTYADVYQPAVIIYGRLPLCPQATICHDTATLNKLKAADAIATSSIIAARAVLEGNVTDTGQIQAATQAIQNAESQIAASAGAFVKPQ